PGLRGVDPNVFEDRFELRAHKRRRHVVHGRYANGVLRRQRNDRAEAVTTRRGERLQVGLNARAAARVRARNRQATWNQPTPFAGMTRIRFDGCVLSRARRQGTPVGQGYHRDMAVGAAHWDDLLAYEEVAHVAPIPAAEARTTPLPAELQPAVRAA